MIIWNDALEKKPEYQKGSTSKSVAVIKYDSFNQNFDKGVYSEGTNLDQYRFWSELNIPHNKKDKK